MDKKIDVSVTYTIYGNFDLRRLKSALFYLAKQEEVSFEAVVVNATSESINLPKFCKQIRIDESEAEKNLGLIRNIALKNCSGKYIYTCDADILFIDKLFLKKLIGLQKKTNVTLKKVDMLRLPQEEFDDFFEKLIKGKEPELNKSNLSVSLTDNFPFKLNLVGGYRFTQRINGKDSTPLVHAGCTFGEKYMYECVGGYSEEYEGYGWEDSDIQWKLEEKYGIEKIENLKVIHLDHKKDYFDKKQFEINKSLFFKRVREGITIALVGDLKNYTLIKGGIKQIYK